MEKHCDSERRFGKEGTAARNEVLEEFLRKSGERAYQYAYRLSGNCDEAHELVQDAMYRVTRAWDRYKTRKSLHCWFFVILRNAFKDSRRRHGARGSLSFDLPLEGTEGDSLADVIPDTESLPAGLEREETVSRVRGALAALTPEHRTILKLCDMDGKGYDDIARTLGVPMGTVRSRIFRARQALRTQSPELAALAE